MKLTDFREVHREETVMVSARIPVSYKKFIDKNRLSITHIIKRTVEKLIEDSKK